MNKKMAQAATASALVALIGFGGVQMAIAQSDTDPTTTVDGATDTTIAEDEAATDDGIVAEDEAAREGCPEGPGGRPGRGFLHHHFGPDGPHADATEEEREAWREKMEAHRAEGEARRAEREAASDSDTATAAPTP